jgi:hypothetical protein
MIYLSSHEFLGYFQFFAIIINATDHYHYKYADELLELYSEFTYLWRDC